MTDDRVQGPIDPAVEAHADPPDEVLDDPPGDRDPIGESPDDVSLVEVLTAAAEDLVGVRAAVAAEETTWTVGSVPFAAIASGRAEFRLDPLVVAAALRTPDTSPSPRGHDWVAFSPALLDDGAIDRAEAWFLSAHRRLTPKRVD